MRSTTASLSLERKKRPRNEPPQRQGRATPLHTSMPSPRARRRDRPAPRHALFKRRARPCSYPKGEQYPQQAATKKETLDAKEARKDSPRTRSSNDLVDLFTPSRDPPKSRAPPKREADAVYPPQHARSALKNMSVERGKAGPPCEDRSRTRTPPRVHSAKPPHHQAPHQSANPRRRRPTSVPTTTTENATTRAASTPSRGKRPPEPAPLPRAKRATARSTPVAPLAQARRRRVTCPELADRFPTAKPLNDGRTEPFRTSRRAPRCAARGPSRTT